MMFHGPDANAAPFAVAVGDAAEAFIKGLSSADFRRIVDPRNHEVVLAALRETRTEIVSLALLALITFAGGELARSVALVKEQLGRQLGNAAKVEAYLVRVLAWVRSDAGAARPQRVIVHDVYKGAAFAGEDVCELLRRHQGGKSKLLAGTSATALFYRVAKHVLAGRGGRISGQLTSHAALTAICVDAGFNAAQIKGVADFKSLAHFVGKVVADKIAAMWERHVDPDVIAIELKSLSAKARLRNVESGEPAPRRLAAPHPRRARRAASRAVSHARARVRSTDPTPPRRSYPQAR